MGLHGSPTCAMAFDGAQAVLLGQPGRGIRQLFAMIGLMRLQTACQGLGVAQAACAIARSHAAQRRQGGAADAPAVPILSHPDVRRQLAEMEASTELLRALVLEVASLIDLARAGDPDAGALAGLLLPLAKTFGAETGFDVASGATQVLGGAGYTRDWPVEQLMRDARAIAIYEGTTGMQAQDFLFRQLLRDDGTTLRAFQSRAAAEIATCPDRAAARVAQDLLERFSRLARALLSGEPALAPPELAADGYMRAGWAAISGWMACRLIGAGSELARPGRLRLHLLPAEMSLAETRCRLTESLIG
jgi:hypothetical protein